MGQLVEVGAVEKPSCFSYRFSLAGSIGSSHRKTNLPITNFYRWATLPILQNTLENSFSSGSTWPREFNRIAFGAVLTIPTQNDFESVQTISRFLPNLNLDWGNVRDFIFQVNRPRPCITIPQLGALNRLVKWQSVLRAMLVATIGPQSPAPTTTAEQWAAQCELDISNAPKDPSIMLPHEQLKPLFAELVQQGKEVVSKGSAL